VFEKVENVVEYEKYKLRLKLEDARARAVTQTARFQLQQSTRATRLDLYRRMGQMLSALALPLESVQVYG